MVLIHLYDFFLRDFQLLQYFKKQVNNTEWLKNIIFFIYVF